MKWMKLIFIWLFIPAIVAGQKQAGAFQRFDNWNEVIGQAKAKKKKIFIDAYTTWCAPCKRMDLEVYNNDTVSSFLATHFIAVKIQFDETSSDDDKTKGWYETAKRLKDKYNIEAFPCFIFLDEDGGLMQLDNGFQAATVFMNTLRSAAGKTTFSVKLSDYKAGKFVGRELLHFALDAKANKMDSIACEAAAKYKCYLDSQRIEAVINPDLVTFISNFFSLLSINDWYISYAYNHPDQMDSLMERKGTATPLLDFFITRDVINPLLDRQFQGKHHALPKWEEIEDSLNSRYNYQTTTRVFINRKLSYYYSRSDWDSIVKYELQNKRMYGLDTAGLGRTAFNNFAYDVVFKHTTNRAYLQEVIGFMNIIVESDPDEDAWIDTYANLLYKMGNKNAAIMNQEKAFRIAKERKDEGAMEEYTSKLQKMRANQPTW